MKDFHVKFSFVDTRDFEIEQVSSALDALENALECAEYEGGFDIGKIDKIEITPWLDTGD
jgi:hypothetical protein